MRTEANPQTTTRRIAVRGAHHGLEKFRRAPCFPAPGLCNQVAQSELCTRCTNKMQWCCGHLLQRLRRPQAANHTEAEFPEHRFPGRCLDHRPACLYRRQLGPPPAELGTAFCAFLTRRAALALGREFTSQENQPGGAPTLYQS
jgi:hypothetical protein